MQRYTQMSTATCASMSLKCTMEWVHSPLLTLYHCFVGALPYHDLPLPMASTFHMICLFGLTGVSAAAGKAGPKAAHAGPGQLWAAGFCRHNKGRCCSDCGRHQSVPTADSTSFERLSLSPQTWHSSWRSEPAQLCYCSRLPGSVGAGL